MKTIQELRKEKIKCRVIHRRYLPPFPTDNDQIPFSMPTKDIRQTFGSLNGVLPNGGETKIELLYPDGTIKTTQSVCSFQDQFNYKVGIRVALAKLFHEKLDKTEYEKHLPLARQDGFNFARQMHLYETNKMLTNGERKKLLREFLKSALNALG